jgi:hypothetical protein
MISRKHDVMPLSSTTPSHVAMEQLLIVCDAQVEYTSRIKSVLVRNLERMLWID